VNKKKIILITLLEILVIIAYLLLMRSGNSSWEETLASIFLHKRIVILNIILLSLSLLILILLSGRYWIGVSIFLMATAVICIATFEKMQFRNEVYMAVVKCRKMAIRNCRFSYIF